MPHPRAPHSEDSYEAQGSSALTRFLSGLMAFSGGVFICGACSSYNSADPSLNMAVSRTQDPVTNAILEAGPENMFGSVGAVFGEHHRRKRGGPEAADFDDADSVEGSGHSIAPVG